MAEGSLSTHDAPAPEHVEDDPLAPARGVVIGLVLSASFWILVALLLIRS